MYVLKEVCFLFYFIVFLNGSYIKVEGGRIIDILIGDMLNLVYNILN